MAVASVGSRLGRGFAGSQMRTYLPFAQAVMNPQRDFANMLVGAACGVIAVCGLQIFMVIKSEAALSRSVEAVSE